MPVPAEMLRLYLILETSALQMPLKNFLEEVIAGGVTAVQLRDKFSSYDEKLEKAYRIKEYLSGYSRHILFIINDSAEIAVKSGADGVHLGEKDEPPNIIRARYPNLLIGFSCNNTEDCLTADSYADYAGIGPFAYTGTKKDLRRVIGFGGVKKYADYLSIPSVAIGGIDIDSAREAIDTGTSGLAVSSYLCSSKKPYEDAKRMRDIIDERIGVYKVP